MARKHPKPPVGSRVWYLGPAKETEEIMSAALTVQRPSLSSLAGARGDVLTY